MIISALSDIGNFRDINQDCINYKIINEHEAYAVLCDGMGGHNAGEVAAKLTCDYMMDHFEDHEPFTCQEDIRHWFYRLIKNANRLVNEKGADNSAYRDMGTTVILAYIVDECIYISHVGDSRAYIVTSESLEQITTDDTLVNALLEKGYINKEQAKNHPQRNILVQAVGVTDLLNVSFAAVHADTILLCSDGLYNSLSDDQIVEILKLDLTIQQKNEKLMETAKQFGGLDNISTILIERGA
jgi:protein phosphatase